MFRPTVLAALAFLPCLQPAQTPISSTFASTCADVFPHQPIVVYEIAGGTLAGPFDLELLVYNDGAARLSSSTANFGAGKSRNAFVGGTVAQALLSTLSQDGAFRVCDDPTQTSDLPLSTLSVARGVTDARIHSSSWFAASGDQAALQQTLQAFIAAHFPGF